MMKEKKIVKITILEFWEQDFISNSVLESLLWLRTVKISSFIIDSFFFHQKIRHPISNVSEIFSIPIFESFCLLSRLHRFPHLINRLALLVGFHEILTDCHELVAEKFVFVHWYSYNLALEWLLTPPVFGSSKAVKLAFKWVLASHIILKEILAVASKVRLRGIGSGNAISEYFNLGFL